MRNLAVPLAAAIIGLGASDALAHHSFAPHFDASKPVNISGTVKEFEARNPHSYVHIDAVDENGRTHEYVCESNGWTQLNRNGLSPAMLKAGTKIRVTGSLSRHSAYMCFFNTVEFEDGRKINVGGAGSPSTPPAVAKRADIFGTWLLAPIPNRQTSGPQPMIELMTPAGQKAVAGYDPFKDDPVFRCDPVAIRRVWGAPGTPMEIVRTGDDIVIHAEWMDVRRVVHMNVKTPPKNTKRTSLGYSVGHMDGDTLVIETASFAPGVLNQYVEMPGKPIRGLLHSAALTVTERIHFDAERQMVIVEVDQADPDFFTQPFPRATTGYRPTDLKIEPFNCSREGVTGTIRK
jgi:hypothetical protein